MCGRHAVGVIAPLVATAENRPWRPGNCGGGWGDGAREQAKCASAGTPSRCSSWLAPTRGGSESSSLTERVAQVSI
jgi:hypothetical protein